jgi:hypothetical protein
MELTCEGLFDLISDLISLTEYLIMSESKYFRSQLFFDHSSDSFDRITDLEDTIDDGLIVILYFEDHIQSDSSFYIV